MATLKIEPITVQSQGNRPVVITGIRPTDPDCIVGQYWKNHVDGPYDAVWNLSDLMRDGSDPLNLNMKNDELADLETLLINLGARK
ncbi:MAG: hypothetical protein WBD95_01945 [Xanthobacteraceae bacterium]